MGKGSTEYFDIQYRTIFVWNQDNRKSAVKKKIDYFQKFLKCKEVNIVGISNVTINDSKNDFYSKALDLYVKNNNSLRPPVQWEDKVCEEEISYQQKPYKG